jgi:hypothetical protein
MTTLSFYRDLIFKTNKDMSHRVELMETVKFSSLRDIMYRLTGKYLSAKKY